MHKPRPRGLRDIKHAQRESFLFKELSDLFLKIAIDDPRLHEYYVTRATLTPNRGHCTLFFHTPAGHDAFKAMMPVLILYKPSLRSALSKSLQTRYTPELHFEYDAGIDKQNKIEDLFNRLHDEGKL